MTRLPKLFVAAAACVALAPPAYAQAAIPQIRQHYSFDGQRIIAQQSVPYGDLDITSPQGARTLLERIEAAAAAVCRDNTALPTVRDCREAAVGRAVAQMKSPALARAVAESRTPSRGR
jgi:UrcA family protein